MSGERRIVYFLGAGASFGAGAYAPKQGSGRIPIPTQSTFWETFLRFCRSRRNKRTLKHFFIDIFSITEKYRAARVRLPDVVSWHRSTLKRFLLFCPNEIMRQVYRHNLKPIRYACGTRCSMRLGKCLAASTPTMTRNMFIVSFVDDTCERVIRLCHSITI